jgi:cell division protein ZapB
MKAECVVKFDLEEMAFVRLPLRGQRRLKIEACGLDFLLLPVELQCVNHTASTNKRDSTRAHRQLECTPTMDLAMSNSIQIEQITERVERLLLRYEELQRTNALLVDQVSVLTQERDSLQSRLSAARSRVEALLERLPEASFGSISGPGSTASANGATSPPAKTPAGTER